MNDPQGTAAPCRPSVRWWPAGVVVLLSGGIWAWVWLYYGVSRQQKIIASAQVLFGTFVALLLWMLLASRLRWRVRLGIAGAALGIIGFGAATLTIRGVTGDLLPVLEWRWSRQMLPAVVTNMAVSTGSTNVPAFGYPQFLGPARNGIVLGPTLMRDWRAYPPTQLWQQPVGAAWSGFAVSGSYVVTQEQRGEKECVVGYDLLTGQTLWTHADEAHYSTTIAGEGPRATPTIVSNHVFALGATGFLNCLDLATGKKIWDRNILEENQGKVRDWGVAGSPLVVGNLIIVSAGGKVDRSLVAYDFITGQFIWGAGHDSMDYSSPLHARLAGIEQVLIFNPGGLTAHDLVTGKVLWRYRWPGGHPHITVPLVLPEDRVLISSGYGTGAEMIKVANTNGWSATRLWKSNRLKSKFANLIIHGGYIYGLDDGILVCLDAADGSLKWKEGRYGHGQMILANDVLLVMAESGDVVLIEPSPGGLRELARLPVFKDKTWNPPALAGEFLLVRNDKEAACYRLAITTK